MAFGLLRFEMLELPAAVLSAGAVVPRNQGQKRFKAVLDYLGSPQEDRELRKVAVCLRLALIAVGIAAQTKKVQGRLPVLARLGQGQVQERTTKELGSILQAPAAQIRGGPSRSIARVTAFAFFLAPPAPCPPLPPPSSEGWAAGPRRPARRASVAFCFWRPRRLSARTQRSAPLTAWRRC